MKKSKVQVISGRKPEYVPVGSNFVIEGFIAHPPAATDSPHEANQNYYITAHIETNGLSQRRCYWRGGVQLGDLTPSA